MITYLKIGMKSSYIELIFVAIGIIFSILLLLIMYIYMDIRYINNYYYPFALLFSFIIYIILNKNKYLNDSKEKIKLDFRKNKILLTMYFVLFVSSIFVINARVEDYSRPLVYYFIFVGMILIILYYSINNSSKGFVTLFLLIITTINVILSQFLLFPGFFGKDPWYFAYLVNEYSKYQNPDLGYYGFTPLALYFQSIGQIIIYTDIKTTVMLFGVIVQIILFTIFIFIITKTIFNSVIPGLLACLILTINPAVINYIITTTPFTFATIFILMLIYIIIKNNITLSHKFLYLLLIISITLTHNIAIILTVAISVCVIIYLYISKQKYHSLFLYIFPLIMLLYSWAYFGIQIERLTLFLSVRFHETWDFDPVFFDIPLPRITYIDYIIDLVLPIFIMLGIVGIIFMLLSNTDKKQLLALLILIPCILYFIQLFAPVSFVIDRWYFYTFLFLSIPISYTLHLLFQSLTKYNYMKLVTIFLIFSLSFLSSIGTSIVDTGFDTKDTIYSLKMSEMHSLKAMDVYAIEYVGADAYYFTRLDRSVNNNFTRSDINFELVTGNFSNLANHSIIVREQIKVNNFELERTSTKLHYDIDIALLDQKYHKVYSNDRVVVYRN